MEDPTQTPQNIICYVPDDQHSNTFGVLSDSKVGEAPFFLVSNRNNGRKTTKY